MFVGLDTPHHRHHHQHMKPFTKIHFSNLLLHCTRLWYACVIIHDKPVRQETRPVQASSGDMNTLKLKITLNFSPRHLYSIYAKVPFLTRPTHTDKAA